MNFEKVVDEILRQGLERMILLDLKTIYEASKLVWGEFSLIPALAFWLILTWACVFPVQILYAEPEDAS